MNWKSLLLVKLLEGYKKMSIDFTFYLQIKSGFYQEKGENINERL